MNTLVIGRKNSGKSALAEELAMNTGDATRYYLASMEVFDDEGSLRVEKHRKARAGKGFITIEKGYDIWDLEGEVMDIGSATVLLECVSNLVGNEMYEASNKGKSNEELIELIMESVLSLKKSAKNLVIVSNSFPLDDEGYDEDTRRYAHLVQSVNEELKNISDEIHEYIDERWT